MSEESDNLNEKLDKILSKLPKEDSSKPKILEVSEKLLIPALLGLLAFITNQAGNQISGAQLELSKSQLKLAEAQNSRQESEAKSNLQTKYIELFYKEISSQDAKKQEYALSFLKLIPSEVAAPLLSWADTVVKPEAQPQVNAARNEINSRIPISYIRRVYIQYGNNKARAEQLQKYLQDKGILVPGIERVQGINNNDIRYSNPGDQRIAEQLKANLEQNQNIKFELVDLSKAGYNVQAGQFEIWLKD